MGNELGGRPVLRQRLLLIERGIGTEKFNFLGKSKKDAISYNSFQGLVRGLILGDPPLLLNRLHETI